MSYREAGYREADMDVLQGDAVQRTAPRTAAGLLDSTFRDDADYTFKFNHRHRDGTVVAHDVSELCSELRVVPVEAAEQSGPLDAASVAAALDAAWLDSGDAQNASRPPDLATHLYARLIPQPAQPAREPLPLTGHIHQPEDCPWCKALVALGGEAALALAEPAQPADTALRVVEGVIMSEPAWPRSGAVRRKTIMAKIRAALAAQPSSSGPAR